MCARRKMQKLESKNESAVGILWGRFDRRYRSFGNEFFIYIDKGISILSLFLRHRLSSCTRIHRSRILPGPRGRETADLGTGDSPVGTVASRLVCACALPASCDQNAHISLSLCSLADLVLTTTPRLDQMSAAPAPLSLVVSRAERSISCHMLVYLLCV